MKKVLKYLAYLIGVLFFLGIAAYFYFNESEPVGQAGSEADQLAEKMMESVNKTAWDTTHILQWSFRGSRHFLWDKQRHLTEVKWDSTRVLLDINQKSGKAYENGSELTGEAADKAVQSAWEAFCNDSFWFNAVVKAKDPGTRRSIVTLDDGRKGLKVEYGSGGVTPGDSYVWILDENNRPTSYKMWVQIIPVGGMEFTWENWETLATGAVVSTYHKSDVGDLPITNVKGATNLSAFGLQNDPFAPILE